jgi:cytochrome b involved in lipid metabolism
MRLVLAGLLLLSVLVVSGCVQQDGGGNVAPDGGGTPATYTLAQVSAHSAASDCWLVIHGAVYDVTAFIPEHIGKDAILQGCGKDATTLFEERPMGSGTPHSERARGLLQQYYIGDLAGGG